MISLLFISALAYAAVILFLRRGLYRLEDRLLSSNNYNDGNLTFTVVIAARNEERNIGECLRSIFTQDMPSDRYDVIVVDDRSDDNTADILRDYQRQYGDERLKIITVRETPPGVAPKKYAVSRGVAAAAGEIVVFTDADCRVSSGWLSSINKYFTPDTGLVQGITSYKYVDGMDKTFWGLQSVDFLSHGIIAAAAIGAGLPINSNANNFAFRKAAFEDVGGYGSDGSRIVSGDDDYLLQKIWRSRKWKIRFMADPSGSVETAPTQSARGVFEQRKRWGSKTVYYHTGQVLLLSSVFIFYLMTMILAFMSIINTSYLPILLSMLFVKLSGELVLMIPGTRIFDKKSLRRYIIPASLIQLPMVVAAIFLGVFGKFEWKGVKTGRKKSFDVDVL